MSTHIYTPNELNSTKLRPCSFDQHKFSGLIQLEKGNKRYPNKKKKYSTLRLVRLPFPLRKNHTMYNNRIFFQQERRIVIEKDESMQKTKLDKLEMENH